MLQNVKAKTILKGKEYFLLQYMVIDKISMRGFKISSNLFKWESRKDFSIISNPRQTNGGHNKPQTLQTLKITNIRNNQTQDSIDRRH